MGHRGSIRTPADVGIAIAVGCAAVALVLAHLLLPNVIGSSDTGDQRRLLCQINAGDPHFSAGRNSAERFVAVRLEPIPPNPLHCGAFRVTERYPSSALAVLVPAQQLTHLAERVRLGRIGGALDIRMVGLLYAVLFGLVIGTFVLVLPGPRWARTAVAGALGALGADATFVPYFNSAFSEPMEYVALLGTFAALLALWRRPTVPPWQLAAVTVVFAVLVTAKSQDIPLCVLLGLALLTVRSPLGRLHGRITARVLPAVAATFLLALGATDLYLQPQAYNEQLVYSDVFFTILADSPDVTHDLVELGLPPELAKYAGVTIFAVQDQLAKDPAYQEFRRKITMTDVARFYLHHPDRLGPVTRTAVQDVVKARHPLPNTTRGETAKPEVVCRICLIPPVGAALAPVATVLWPAWELTVLAVGVVLVRRRRDDLPWRALGLVLIVSVAFAAFHTATAVLGDGYAELAKHVFPAAVDTWMVIPLVALALAGLVHLPVITHLPPGAEPAGGGRGLPAAGAALRRAGGPNEG